MACVRAVVPGLWGAQVKAYFIPGSIKQRDSPSLQVSSHLRQIKGFQYRERWRLCCEIKPRRQISMGTHAVSRQA
eukprot:1142370-Pelagomonas_calceolata.AAC.2